MFLKCVRHIRYKVSNGLCLIVQYLNFDPILRIGLRDQKSFERLISCGFLNIFSFEFSNFVFYM